MSILTKYQFTRPLLWVWPGVFGFLLAFSACTTEKESVVVNQAPHTLISIDTIKLNGANRLITQVKLHWSATDADGYVTGYKLSWGQDAAQAKSQLAAAPVIHQTDSTFLFNFTNGSDTSDIHFFVEAVDDKGLTDSEPATLRIPVKNSTPDIHFLSDGLSQADTLWSVLSFPFTFSDPDGDANIDAIYLKVNDGEWVALPKNASFISLVPQNPETAGPASAVVYVGENLATLNQEPAPLNNVVVPGLQVNGRNQLYLKIVDRAGATYLDTCERNYYLKRKTSDLLLIDAYRGVGVHIGDTVNTSLVAAISTFDRIALTDKDSVNQSKFWNSNFYLLCKQYKKIFWYSDLYSTKPGENPLLLTYAAASFNQYLRFNGKLLISATFPDGASQLPSDDAVFSLLPVDSITKQSSDARLRNNRVVYPKIAGYDTLRSLYIGSVPSGFDLFAPKAGIDSLYTLPRTTLTSTYKASLFTVALRSRNPFNNQTNLVFFGIEMRYLSGNTVALQNTFNRILNQEFNW